MNAIDDRDCIVNGIFHGMACPTTRNSARRWPAWPRRGLAQSFTWHRRPCRTPLLAKRRPFAGRVWSSSIFLSASEIPPKPTSDRSSRPRRGCVIAKSWSIARSICALSRTRLPAPLQVAQLLQLQKGAVAVDVAGLLQALDPDQAGAGRQARGVGQVDIAHPAVALPAQCFNRYFWSL